MKIRFVSFGLGSLMSAVLVMGAVSPGANDGVQVLADFDAEDVAGGWRTVNDNVMGGRSKGGPSFADGVLTFAGATNTDGGGFSSIRTEPGSFDLSSNSGLLMRVKGDGRTYKAELRTDVKMRDWAIPFRADFETKKGEWTEIYLPLEAFVPTFFGRELSEAPELEPEKVSSIGFMIYDKQDGPFQLEVDWVKAVTRGSDSDGAGTVVDALAGGEFGTLAAALKAAGLLEALQGEGPFTVFAPTDEAFAKLPEGTVESLLKPENLERLQAVLEFHVSAGEARLTAALAAGEAETLQGERVAIGFDDGRVRVNGAAILKADLAAGNGVVHVIDSVLLPPEPANDIASVAKRAGSFGTLLAAVEAAGLLETLAGAGPVTVLAPTDEAFAKLPEGTVENLLKEENREQLRAVLAYHAIAGSVSAGDALNAGKAKTLNGASVAFGIEDGVFKVNGATIRSTDLAADNGVIHVIDAVLLPPSGDVEEAVGEVVESQLAPTDRIEAAIDRGVPLFNRGDAGECAVVYRECLTVLSEDASVDPALRKGVKRLLTQAKRAHDDVERAWIYRGGLDQLYVALARHSS